MFLLLFVILFPLLLIPSISYGAVNDTAFYMDFNDSKPDWSLPYGAKEFFSGVQYIQMANDTRVFYFNGVNAKGVCSGSAGYGIGPVTHNVGNFTFEIKFAVLNISDPLAMSDMQLVFSLRKTTFTGLSPILTLGIDYASTSPLMLFQWNDNSGKNIFTCSSPVSYGEWVDLILTYSPNVGKYYIFVNSHLWSMGDASPVNNALLESGLFYDMAVGAWKVVFTYENYFGGYIDFLQFNEYFMSPYTITNLVAQYKFDEGNGNVAIDSSGNGNDGVIDSVNWQYTTSGKYGYALSGQFDSVSFGVNMTENPIPLINDKFSASMWFYYSGIVASSSAYDHWLFCSKTFFWRMEIAGTTLKTKFELGLSIGGIGRTLTSTEFGYSTLVNRWIYVYSSFDGATLVFTICGTNTSTPWYNGTASYSGTISEQIGPGFLGNNKYGFCGSESGAGASYRPSGRIDEFKMTNTVLGAYMMNGTSLGTPTNGTRIWYGSNENLWFNATLNPTTVTCNPTGEIVLYVNSSGNFQVNCDVSDPKNDLIQGLFIMEPETFAWNNYFPGVHVQPMKFTVKNDSIRSGTYPGYLLVHEQQWPNRTLVLNFYLIVPPKGGEVIQNKTASWICILDKELTLIWDTAKSGYVTIMNVPTHEQYFDVDGTLLGQPAYFTVDDSRKVGYLTTSGFSTRIYTVKIQIDGLYYDYNYIEVHYSLDSSVMTYGNFTIYHTVKVFDVSNPNDYTLKRIIIHVKVSSTLTVTQQLWATVSPNTIAGLDGETRKATLSIYTNYRTDVHWEVPQAWSSWDYRYTAISGDVNDRAANYSVNWEVVIPLKAGMVNLRVRIVDLNNPLVFNETTFYVTNTRTVNATFDFTISPNAWNMQPGGLYTFQGHIIASGVSTKHFYLSHINTHSSFLSISYVADQGTVNHADVPIQVSCISDANQVPNGTWKIEVTCYTSDAADGYISKTITITITGGHLIVTPNGTPPVQPPYGGGTITPLNYTILNPTQFIPQVPLMEGWFKTTMTSFAGYLGFPFSGLLFLVGCIFLVVTMIAVAKGSEGGAPPLVYVIAGVCISGFNVYISLWPPYIMILLTLFGVALLAERILSRIGGDDRG
jgi:hypothetical protein